MITTINALRRGELSLDNVPPYDWTTTRIMPVIITEEKLPQAPLLWEHLYAPFDEPFGAVRGGAGAVERLRLISIDEVESIPEIESTVDLATLMYRWAARPEYFELPWMLYLDLSGIKTNKSFIPARFFEAAKFLADGLGLDSSKLRPPWDH